MGLGRLRVLVLPALFLLSLLRAEGCSGAAAWVLTQPQLQAFAGDSVLLQCHFQDPSAMGWSMVKVDWLRVPGAGEHKEEMVFYYYSNRSIPVGLFRKRVQWRGDMSRRDGSILLRDAQVNDSGTYVCEVRLLQRSSIFKNHTVLRVSPGAHRERGAVGAAAAPGSTAFWSMVVGGCCVAVVLAFLAGLGLRRRSAANSALERSSNGDNKIKMEEGFYFSIPGTGVPKAEQDTGKKSRAEETYITMHPSIFRENGIYVELTRRVIPAEWMDGKRQEDVESPQPDCRAPRDPAALQRAPSSPAVVCKPLAQRGQAGNVLQAALP